MVRLFSITFFLLFVTLQSQAMMIGGPCSPCGDRPQPDWPNGLASLLKHESGVYQAWVNGNERIYFNADLVGINELMALYSRVNIRDHRIRFEIGSQSISYGDERAYRYNVLYDSQQGIGNEWGPGRTDSNESILTIYLSPDEAPHTASEFVLPSNIIIEHKAEEINLPPGASLPSRTGFYGNIQYENGKPAVDFEIGVFTKVTLWKRDVTLGIYLGSVDYRGLFYVALSDKELRSLEDGETWLTTTVGNGFSKAQPDDPKLPFENLGENRFQVAVRLVDEPEFYYVRILQADDTPSDLEISLSVPYVRSTQVDAEGLFRVFVDDDHIRSLRSGYKGMGISIHGAIEAQRAFTEGITFPTSKLTKDPEQAHLLYIPIAKE